MKYISTRGAVPAIGFQDAVMTGLARDGGLFIPERIPDVRAHLAAWKTLAYGNLAYEIMRRYADLPERDLRALIDRSITSFRHPDVSPVVPLGDLHILELFHGPTLAFKDVALQFLGRLFEYVLAQSDRQLNILAATSGDTGSAAIAGVRGRRRMRIFVLYPLGRVSPIQERQMTTVPDENVFTAAVEGSFDDCQTIVKTLFRDLAFRDRVALGAVNSINWARLMSQVVYYFYAAFRVMERTGKDRVRFTVPTGNFGDIFAGYLAWRMGLPVGRLVLATNENDILSRFFNTGVYRRGRVTPTLSPSMDIQVASNFERYLYYCAGEDPRRVCEWMDRFRTTGELRVECRPGGGVDPLFAAGSADTPACLAAIRAMYESRGYLLDPHSAVGVHVAQSFLDPEEPMICLATAHPAKFDRAIQDATGRDLAHHPLLDALNDLPVRRTVLPASDQAVRAFLEEKIGAAN
ncbi:MAG: threonine synthase [Verrucomicrobia bacterium]|nr:threonine synthase [Verrucomicrobiota bacterium]MCG2681103.1 threonine synthase [Kiritimatiellia bacterium]MBU4248212.1 threonine synthase [Verrucomicrobiota bacterium]MBU4292326.1 threonine synthase [Verrucomicrobiota bacterium]MBU4428623.1 threonine synthase [Verrucomicrobiota bacterium]